MIGTKFGLWRVKEEVVKTTYSGGRTRKIKGYNCECECGLSKWVSGYTLTKGKSKGCAKCRSGMRSHGMSNSDLYHIWEAMKQRCLNPKHDQFKDYGGRGISICDEWVDDPKAFIIWAECNGYCTGLQLDRRENEGNYSESNCRFISQQRNLLNKRLLSSSNNTGQRGVAKIKLKNKYIFLSLVGFKGVTYKLGRYDNVEVAGLARDLFCVEFGIPLPLNNNNLSVKPKFIQPSSGDISYWRGLTSKDIKEMK